MMGKEREINPDEIVEEKQHQHKKKPIILMVGLFAAFMTGVYFPNVVLAYICAMILSHIVKITLSKDVQERSRLLRQLWGKIKYLFGCGVIGVAIGFLENMWFKDEPCCSLHVSFVHYLYQQLTILL